MIVNGKDSARKKEYEVLSNQFKNLKSDYKTSKQLYRYELYRNGILINKCMKLENLKSKHNECGSGRKRTIKEV